VRAFSSSSASSRRIVYFFQRVRNVDVQRSGDRPSPGMFGFPFFAISANRLSSILLSSIFTWSLLILAHLESRSLANIANSIPHIAAHAP